MIAAENDAVNFVLLALADFIENENLIGLALKCGFDFRVEIAFLLEVFHQILLAFLHQIGIEGGLGINRNQLLLTPS